MTHLTRQSAKRISGRAGRDGTRRLASCLRPETLRELTPQPEQRPARGTLHCTKCHAGLTGSFVGTSRLDGEVKAMLSTHCRQCGPGAAREHLAALGIRPAPLEPFSTAPVPCARCRRRRLLPAALMVGYAVERFAIEGDTLQPDGLYSMSLVCGACERPAGGTS